jgi:hypothetical protein
MSGNQTQFDDLVSGLPLLLLLVAVLWPLFTPLRVRRSVIHWIESGLG